MTLSLFVSPQFPDKDSRTGISKIFVFHSITKLFVRNMAEGRPSGHDEDGSLDEVEMGSDTCCNLKDLPPGDRLVLALIGKTGHGKSATGNSILGKDAFKTSMSFDSITHRTQVENNVVGGRQIVLVDTPGTLDTLDPGKALEEISFAITHMPDGFHAILLILKVNTRMTEEEVMAIELLKAMFGPKVMTYVVFVFTNGDSFNSYMDKQKKKMTFQKFISSQSGPVATYIKECGNRCVLINNMEKNAAILREQIIELIETVDILVARNNGKKYTNELFSFAKEKLEEEEMIRFQTGKRRSKTHEKVNISPVSNSLALKEMKESIKEKIGKLVAELAKKKGMSCFPPNCSVRLEDGSTIEIAKLCIGHKVLSSACRGKLMYSKVYFIAHSKPNYITEYITISTLRHKLTLTPDHHIYIANKGGSAHTVPARKVKIGDKIIGLSDESSSLEEEPVTELSRSIQNGIYAPITMSGNIIVDNVLTSCYVDFVPPKISHLLLWPMRRLDRVVPSLSAWIHREGNDGMPVWVKWIMDIFV